MGAKGGRNENLVRLRGRDNRMGRTFVNIIAHWRIIHQTNPGEIRFDYRQVLGI